MKVKTSITLSGELLETINLEAGTGRRSEFIETAVRGWLRHLRNAAIERRDLEILNRRAGALNAEAEDVLAYQEPL